MKCGDESDQKWRSKGNSRIVMANLKWISGGKAARGDTVRPRPNWIPSRKEVIKMSQHETRIVLLSTNLIRRYHHQACREVERRRFMRHHERRIFISLHLPHNRVQMNLPTQHQPDSSPLCAFGIIRLWWNDCRRLL